MVKVFTEVIQIESANESFILEIAFLKYITNRLKPLDYVDTLFTYIVA